MCTRILEVQEWQVREWVARAPQPHLETAVPCGVDGTTWSASSTLTSSASVPARPRRREARPHRSGRGAASASASARCSSLAAAEDNIKALLISVVSTQATRLEHRNMRTRAFAFSLFDRLAVDRAPRSFSTALLLSLTTTLADRKPLRHLRPTITHPLVSLTLAFILAHTLAHWLSHTRRKQRWH